MAAVLIAILSLTALGVPLVVAIDRDARGPLLLGLAFLYGSGAIFLIMLAMSVVHVPWTLPPVVAAALIVGAIALFTGSRTRHPALGTHHSSLHVVDIATAVTLAGYALYATIAPLWEWDFWAIWGLKARVFLEAGGIDWRFLESRWNTFAHPDYPLLLPLNLDFLALAAGGWDDRWLGILFLAFGVALLLIIRSLAARETPTLFAAVITFAMASIAISRYIGMAEGPLIAFGGAGVLFARDALRTGDKASWRHAAVLLGFAANCKNEGLALLVAVTVALVVVGLRRQPGNPPTWRLLLRLWPAFAIAAPWLLLRATHVLATDIAAGSVVDRLLLRLHFTPQILGYLASHLYDRWFWVAVLAALVIAPAEARRGEAFVMLVTAIQLAFYVGSYFVTPHDIRWHVATSWSRLTDQLAVPLTYVAMVMLAGCLPRGEDAPHAEARSEQ